MPLDADAQPLPRLRRGRPPKTAAERDEGNRRKDLIAAAARLFRSQGFDGTSTRDIAAAANMQSGSPFYFFQSKRAILHAVAGGPDRDDLDGQPRMRCFQRTLDQPRLGEGER